MSQPGTGESSQAPQRPPLFSWMALLRDDRDVPRRVIAFRQIASRFLLWEEWLTLLPIAYVGYRTGTSPLAILLIGGMFAGLSTLCYRASPVSLATRYALANGLLVNVLLLIYALSTTGSWQLDGGHMWVFAVWSHCLALLCWRALTVSGFLGVLHHFILIFLMPAFVFPDGADFGRVLLHGGVVVMQAGAQIVFIFLIFRMLWFAENLERALKKNSDELENINAAKSRFLAMMSHELRTPLNAIIGFSDVMKSEVFGPLGNPRYGEYVHDVHRSGQHLLAIINDILDLSKVEAGKVEVALEEVPVECVTADCFKLVAGVAEQSQVSLKRPVYNGVVAVTADARLVKQMLVNLLSNACKYTLAKGSVGVTWAETDDHVSVAVSDTGIGMSTEDIDIALQPFGQVSNPMVTGKEGTGLGLPLVKSLVEAHGGQFSIQSRRGIGTTVTLGFPKPARRPAPPEKRPAVATTPSLEQVA